MEITYLCLDFEKVEDDVYEAFLLVQIDLFMHSLVVDLLLRFRRRKKTNMY